MNKEAIQKSFEALQDEICAGLERLDGKALFEEDIWERTGGGGGKSRVMATGDLIEKGGVNFSAVHGKMPEKILKALRLNADMFFATGVSIVLHPANPFVPIIHMNIRYFEMSDGNYWFGGGIDLTPHYIDLAEAKFFHQSLKHTCDKFNPAFYPKFKRQADEYFYIPHRKETRGVGGIFFDRLSSIDSKEKQRTWEFVMAVGGGFLPAYSAMASEKRTISFTDTHKAWQYLRRGRYVEFNLVYDKGTKFGLDTDGRAESILMSLPPHAGWVYDHQPAPDSDEQATLNILKKNIDWLNA